MCHGYHGYQLSVLRRKLRLNALAAIITDYAAIVTEYAAIIADYSEIGTHNSLQANGLIVTLTANAFLSGRVWPAHSSPSCRGQRCIPSASWNEQHGPGTMKAIRPARPALMISTNLKKGRQICIKSAILCLCLPSFVGWCSCSTFASSKHM